MKIKLTVEAPETDLVHTRTGQITYRKWLESEACRMIASGRSAQIKTRINKAGQALAWMEEER